MAINTKVVLSAAAVELMTEAIIISGGSINKIDPFVTHKAEAGANSIAFTIFSRMAAATAPLVDGVEATSESMDVSKILLEPLEYGKVITTTNLANMSTAGKGDLAAAELVGINIGETTDTLGIRALEAGGTETDAITLDTLAKEDLRAAYNKLATAGIAKFDDGRYVAFVNPTQISDIKDTFITIAQNTNLGESVSGMVGALEGFTIIEDSNVTQGKVSCFGRGAVGKAVSLEPELRITDGTDNLNRFLNIGWVGFIKYGAIDDNAIEVIIGA